MDANATNPNTGEDISKEKLVTDLKAVAHDAEELLKATAGEVGEKVSTKFQAARERLGATLEKAKESAQKIQEKARAGIKVTDQCIREHPYHSIGIAFCVGLVIGVLIKRK